MNQRTYGFLLALFATVFAGSAALLLWYGVKSHRQAAVYGQLAAAVQRADPTPTQAGEGTPLSDYRALSQENPDMVGWIRIEGTDIDYPVVQRADEPNYYLKHDFAGRYTDFGCPFAQANCDVQTPSDNVILYGHNMKDGSMFSDLVRYQSRSFWETHRTIHIDTLTRRGEYEVLAVCRIPADAFAFHTFVDAADAMDFADYVAACKELALYDTGVNAQYGDKLLTLSTCEYSQENGRLLVVAKRRDGENL